MVLCAGASLEYGDKQCPQTRVQLWALLLPGTHQTAGLEQGFPTPTALVLFVLKQHWEEIFSYSEEPCLIICVAFLMNYKELLLLAKRVPDATPQAEIFGFFK